MPFIMRVLFLNQIYLPFNPSIGYDLIPHPFICYAVYAIPDKMLRTNY